ncbi:homoserine kinase [Microaerobacter geothermalis]|uniref:homoserine kinase n=1 Tax=Microaerobacter geothermalis TaxID=674972 RepID=UPI001F4649DD|nr:homoserine kinase [Microaerobacter geothermalis]MCF6092724.1 homoserine kinase [Microaerobacter geothermalis]
MEGKVRVKVPGSTANLGPAFDTVGMAFQLYTTIDMQFSQKTRIKLLNENLEGLPEDESNLVFQVAQQVFQKAGFGYHPLDMTIKTEIPLTRGLGSSAAAIIGGMVAANALIGEPLSKEEIYVMATELEGHPDNVGASLFGGIVVAVMEKNIVPFVKLLPPEDLSVVAIIPSFHLPTEKARGVLPQQYEIKKVIHAVSHTGLLLTALATGNLDLLPYAMQDQLHQPYRAPLIPGMNEILQTAVNHGALGVALSGAGPTLIAFTKKGKEDGVIQFLEDAFRREQIEAKGRILPIDHNGVSVERLSVKNSAIV